MKKIIYVLSVTVLLAIGIFSCKKESVQDLKKSQNQSLLSKQAQSNLSTLLLDKESNYLTETSQMLGIYDLALQKTSNSSYKVEISSNSRVLNGIETNFQDYSFTISEKANDIVKISLSSNNYLIINSKANKISSAFIDKKFINFHNDNYIENMSIFKRNKMVMLLVIAEEVLSRISDRSFVSLAAPRNCGTFISINFGVGRSAAEERTTNEVDAFLGSNSNCSLVGEIDSSCLFDNHGCVASAEIDCAC